MGRIVPPNWGRSFPSSRTDGPPVELVRVELPTSADLTLYLGDPYANMFMWPIVNEAQITWGNGGTAREMTLFPSMRGDVIHFVASRLVVRSKVFVGGWTIPDDQLPLLRVTAMAALGRPYSTDRVLFDNANPNNRIIAGEAPRTFELSPWCDKVQVRVGGSPAELANVTIAEGVRISGVDTYSLQPFDPVEWASPKPLHPWTNIIAMQNNNPTGQLGVSIIQTFVL